MDTIVVENLVKRYKKSEKLAVDNISFKVKQGEFFAFLGPNGAGKTTTISILTTTLSKTAGTVKIAGFDSDKDSSKIRQNVGIIFQKPSIDLNLSAEENMRFHAILYGLYPFAPSFKLMNKSYQDKVMELANIVGINNELFQQVKTFSGGMTRKLEIIRSLMHSPQILFLDEPTVGLDPENRKNLWSYLQEVRKKANLTIFLTTHYLEEVEDADHVCIINKGKIIVDGTPLEIKKNIAKEYIILSALPNDFSTLIEEVKLSKYQFELENNTIKVYVDSDKDSQNFIKQLHTSLTKLDIKKASLEDAYIEIIHETLDI